MSLILLTPFFLVRGIPHAAFEDRSIEVVALAKDSPAGAGGLQVGERIVNLEGVQNPTWQQGLALVSKALPNSTLHLVVEKNSVRRDLLVQVPAAPGPGWPFGYAPTGAVLSLVDAGSPAARAGLKTDDRITGMNGQPVVSASQLVDGIRRSNGEPITLDVRRGEQTLTVRVRLYSGVNEKRGSCLRNRTRSRARDEA